MAPGPESFNTIYRPWPAFRYPMYKDGIAGIADM
ncbi:hypothetical protein CLV72_103228 [Allonocardiopsis opalescens]|uniref:Uncharacterized protein n=1 Tax=Allonocardiopsis opalescens TaxID=1144618 RepID=A0A2T0Q752_9ACTN|nr:hypothetical protein CLV72_103228 [Allonocardiopsis opalescens]